MESVCPGRGLTGGKDPYRHGVSQLSYCSNMIVCWLTALKGRQMPSLHLFGLRFYVFSGIFNEKLLMFAPLIKSSRKHWYSSTLPPAIVRVFGCISDGNKQRNT
ncbi:hypothetical protein XENOCAPTIV_029269 [Xenoophorus captivus]|uniref:Uncharacterized protein n=1 Tax=Xenoophorus captivus TaxID=1517983 RepID=A0ABV0RPR4_9TELE